LLEQGVVAAQMFGLCGRHFLGGALRRMPAIIANSTLADSSRLRPFQVQVKKFRARVTLSTRAFPLGKLAAPRPFHRQNKR